MYTLVRHHYLTTTLPPPAQGTPNPPSPASRSPAPPVTLCMGADHLCTPSPSHHLRQLRCALSPLLLSGIDMLPEFEAIPPLSQISEYPLWDQDHYRALPWVWVSQVEEQPLPWEDRREGAKSHLFHTHW